MHFGFDDLKLYSSKETNSKENDNYINILSFIIIGSFIAITTVLLIVFFSITKGNCLSRRKKYIHSQKKENKSNIKMKKLRH